jgi:signal peptidase I
MRYHKATSFIAGSFYALLLVVAFLFLLMFFGMRQSLLGNYQTRIVMSGSMEPAIQTGSVVLINTDKSAINQLEPGDIITYFSESGTDNTTTHRVNKVKGSSVITKGDANNTIDREPIGQDQIIGTVTQSLPYAGYIANTVFTRTGYIMLLAIPATIVILIELRNIWRELKDMKKPKYVARRPPKKTGKIIAFLVISLSLPAIITLPTTSAQWTATAYNQGNVITAGTWEDEEPPIEPPPLPDIEKLVINEVYYNVADDKRGPAPPIARYQWIELFNPTEQPINLKNWEICGQDWCKTIHSNATIGAGNYALLSHDSGLWPRFWDNIHQTTTKINLGGAPWYDLKLDGDMLLLKDEYGRTIDTMNYGPMDTTWPNYHEDLWDDATDLVAPKGYSLERIKPGLDKNSLDDWQINPIPSPGGATNIQSQENPNQTPQSSEATTTPTSKPAETEQSTEDQNTDPPEKPDTKPTMPDDNVEFKPENHGDKQTESDDNDEEDSADSEPESPRMNTAPPDKTNDLHQ